MQRALILLFAILSFEKCFSQSNSSVSKIAFSDGEQLEYFVSYNWGFIWLDAGIVRFSAKKIHHSQQPAWHFFSTGHSLKKFDWFFKVRDTFEGVCTHNDLKPIWFRRHTFEGGYVIYNKFTFDHANARMFNFTTETNRKPKNDTISIPPNTYDVLTANYIARSMDFSNMKPNDSLSIRLIVDGIVFALPVVFHGQESIKNRDDNVYNCYKFSALLDEGTMFRPGERIYVWVTADHFKIPILIEAKITVGSIKVHLIRSFSKA